MSWMEDLVDVTVLTFEVPSDLIRAGVKVIYLAIMQVNVMLCS